ncbi:MAG: hypothetical protein L3J19_03310 [Sulfurimonas sp.]|nr:hypothetical protein [Sulfurimonas sp.]
MNPKVALIVANQENRYGPNNNTFLQICYYHGEKIESDLVNLVHLPMENMLENLSNGMLRIPEKIDFTGIDVPDNAKIQIEDNINKILSKSRDLQYRNAMKNYETAKTNKLNFNEIMKFYLPASANTRVMQYISKDIYDILKTREYKVMYDLTYGIEKYSTIRKVSEYNPHAIITINNFHNMFLNDEIFNFVWFQDVMPIMVDNEEILLRERDYFFSYTTTFTDLLIKKGVDKNKIFQQQVIPVNTNQFYLDENVNKENKIVFVGSYYCDDYSDYISKDIDYELNILLKKGISLSVENIHEVYKKYNLVCLDNANFITYIQQHYIRNACVDWLCENQTVDVEIYGYDWDKSDKEHILQKFKGKAEKHELNYIYNSTKYALAASGQVINTQRLGEIVHSGAIPLIYDSREITDESETWDDECLYFKTKEELDYILENNLEPKKYRSEEMLKYFTYDSFLDTILQVIDKDVNK